MGNAWFGDDKCQLGMTRGFATANEKKAGNQKRHNSDLGFQVHCTRER